MRTKTITLLSVNEIHRLFVIVSTLATFVLTLKRDNSTGQISGNFHALPATFIAMQDRSNYGLSSFIRSSDDIHDKLVVVTPTGYIVDVDEDHTGGISLECYHPSSSKSSDLRMIQRSASLQKLSGSLID